MYTSMTEDLFDDPEAAYQPLAARLRPDSLQEYVGQKHLLGTGKPLQEAIERGQLHSMVLWGPPGVGKTTLARMVTEQASAHFISLSAVLAGVRIFGRRWSRLRSSAGRVAIRCCLSTRYIASTNLSKTLFYPC